MFIVANMTKGAKQLAKLFAQPTQREIAKRIGVNDSYLSLLASGKRTPSMAVAAKMQRELGIPVEAWVA